MNISQWQTAKLGTPRILTNAGGVLEQSSTLLNNLIRVAETTARLATALALDVTDAQSQALLRLSETLESLIQDFIRPQAAHTLRIPPLVARGQGTGNGKLSSVILNSLQDAHDINRPKYPTESHVAGAFLVLGLNHMYSRTALLDFFRQNQTFQTTLADDDTPLPPESTLPKPTEVDASVVVRPLAQTNLGTSRHGQIDGLEDKPVAIRLTWGPRPSQFLFDLMGLIDVQVTIKEVVIYRSKDEPLPPITDVTSIQEFEYERVKYSAITQENATFYDSDIEERTTYYYAVGYVLEVGDAAENFVSEHEAVGGPIQVQTHQLDSPQTSNKGKPPNWQAFTNPLHTLGIGDSLRILEDQIQQWRASGLSSRNEATRFFENLEATLRHNLGLIQRYTNQVKALQNKLEKFSALGAHTLLFSGEGGTQGISSVISQSLQGSMEDAPNYGSHSIVTGMLLVGGSTTPSGIQGFQRLLELTFASRADTALKDALTALGTTTEEIQQLL